VRVCLCECVSLKSVCECERERERERETERERERERERDDHYNLVARACQYCDVSQLISEEERNFNSLSNLCHPQPRFTFEVTFSHFSPKLILKNLFRKWLCHTLKTAEAHVTRDIFAHNIAIKRYCDKKILRYLRHRNQCPAKVSYYKNTTYLVLCFVKNLPWLINRNLLTEIKISFYCNIVCKMSRVNKA